MSPEQIAKKYGPRVMAILGRIAEALRARGHGVEEPFEMFGDEYKWGMQVHPRWNPPGDHDHDIGIDLEIAESEEFDGTKGGINFSLDIVEFGGLIIGGLTPFNYSDEVWVRRSNPKAVEERFTIFEQHAIPRQVVELIEKHGEGKRGPSSKDWCPPDTTGIIPPVEGR